MYFHPSTNDSKEALSRSVAVALVVAMMFVSTFVSTASGQPTNALGFNNGSSSYSVATSSSVSTAESNAPGRAVSIGLVDWHPLGPKGISSGNSLSGAGKINTLVIDPSDSQEMYAGAGVGQADSGPFSLAGAFKTVNGGRNWTSIDKGLTDSAVDVLSISPDNRSVILAGTWYKGIFESLDQGSQWEQIWSASQGTAAEITSIVWYGGAVYATSSSGILKSENGGSNWTLLWNSPSPANDLSIVNGTWIVSLQDGSVYMKNQTTQLHDVFSDLGWTANIVTLDPRDPAIAFLTEWNNYESGNMYETFDGGQAWTQCFSNTSGMGAIQYVTFSSTDADTVYFGGDGFTYEWNFSRTYSSSSSTIKIKLGNGTYPFSIEPPVGYLASPSSGALAISGDNRTINVLFEPETAVGNASGSRSNPDRIYLQNSNNPPPSIFLLSPTVNGSVVSINGAVNGGGNASVTSVLWNWGDGSTSYSSFPATHSYSLPGTYLVTATAVQIDGQTASASEYVTVEFTVSTVTFVESGLPTYTDWSVQLLFHTNPTGLPLGYDTRMIYATNNGSIYVTSDQGIYATWDNGSKWVSLNGNLSNSLITGFAVSGNDIYSAVQDYGPIFSPNRGASWTVGSINSSTKDPAGGEDGLVAVNPINQSYVYLFTNAGLQVSSNGGETFSSSGVNYSFTGNDQKIAFDPHDPGVLIVAGVNQVWISRDYGKSFVDTGWPIKQPTVVAYYPTNEATIFVGNWSGLYYTTDGGLSWNVSGDTYGYGPVDSISFNHANPDFVLLGFQYSGGGLKLSTNGGLDFSISTSGITDGLLTTLNSPQFWNYVSEVSFSSFNPEVAAASTSSGIYVSTDSGYSWHSIQTDLVPLGVTDLQWVNSTLYVSTYGGGIDYANISLVEQYTVTFAESGLPSGTSWSATLNGTTRSTSSNNTTFLVPNGTYPFTVGSVLGYTVSPSSGSITVNGSSVANNITFLEIPVAKYNVTFTETGLGFGSDWYVSLNGTVKNSTSNEITFKEPNGTYSFHVLPPPGANASPLSGNISVDGTNVSQTVHFSTSVLKVYSVTFYQTGLPEGINWSVTFNGTANTSVPSISFSVPNGTYSYSVASKPGYNDTPSSGSVTVNGHNVSLQVTFTRNNDGYFVPTVIPENASLYVDGTLYQRAGILIGLPAGNSNGSVEEFFNISLPSGTYQVKITAPGYRNYTTTITIASPLTSLHPDYNLERISKPSSSLLPEVAIIAVVIVVIAVIGATVIFRKRRI